VFNQAKLPEIMHKRPRYCCALYNSIFVRIWIFLFTSFEKHVSEQFEPLKRLRVALSNCVPRYKRIISEKQQEKSH